MRENPGYDHTLLICAAAIFLLHSPLTRWWSSLDLPWYAIFIPWLLIIALTALNQWRGGSRGD